METALLAERLWALDSGGGVGGDPECDPECDLACDLEALCELVAIVERLRTVIAVETASFDATGVLTAAGYRSPAGFLAGEGGRLGRGTARRYLACGRVLDQFPLLAAAAEAGEITFDHVAVFARLVPASASAHRRACLARDEAELVTAARSESVTEFSGRCVSWRHLVDPDDPIDERLGREDHGVTVNELDAGSSELVLRGTTAEIEQVRAAINRLADQAWRAQPSAPDPNDKTGVSEVDDATGDTGAPDMGEATGDTGTPDVGEATGDTGAPDVGEATGDTGEGGDGESGTNGEVEAGAPCTQRRHPRRGRLQAQAAAELAARALDGRTGGKAEPVVVVVMDWATFNLEAERYATGTAPPVDVFAPEFRSETLDNHPIPPEQAFLLALRGEIQRCVIGANSLKVDLGRQQRLFNPAGRRAIQVRDRTCVHPACDLPATWADIDHTHDWQTHGPTNTTNGQALCRFHHMQKHRREDLGTSGEGGTAAA